MGLLKVIHADSLCFCLYKYKLQIQNSEKKFYSSA